MNKNLVEKGILSDSGKIDKNKINLITGAMTQPFAEMVWGCVCPQIITYSHILCKWFRIAVLPIDKELYIELARPPHTKQCSVCGKYYVYKSNKSKYCPDCRKIIVRRQAAERKQKQRYLSRNKHKNMP